MTTVNLSTPIVVARDGEDTSVSSLELSMPSAREFVRFGSPFNWIPVGPDSDESRPVFDDKRVVNFIASSARVDVEAVRTLSAPDYVNARWALFFLLRGDKSLNDEDQPKALTLTQPLVTHGGSRKELTFKTPTAKAFCDYGSPYKWVPDENGNSWVSYDDKRMMKFVADATGLDEITLEALPAPDWLNVRDKVFHLIINAVSSAPNP